MDGNSTILWPLLYTSLCLLGISVSINARLFQRLRRLRWRIIHTETTKSAAMAVLSHEIRNPLAGVLSAIGLLRKTPLDSAQQQLIETLDDSGQTLLALLEHTLAQACETGPAMDNHLRFAPRLLLQDLLNLHEAAATNKNILLCSDIHPSLPGHLHGPAAHIRQILHNLLGNAIKFTAGGIIKLTATVTRDGAEPVVAFAVIDTGIGIPADQLDTIFLPYQQAGGAASHHGGKGLGLSISRELAHSLGGELHAHSELGRGSTFTLQIPLATPRQPAIPAGASVVYPSDNNHRAKRASETH